MRSRILSFVGAFLLVSVGLAWAQACRQTFVTPANAKQPITVSTVAVDVALANTSRCSMLIQNTSANPVNCTDVQADGPPTVTIGTPVLGGSTLGLGFEGQGRWQCIRTGAGDATIVVSEGRP